MAVTKPATEVATGPVARTSVETRHLKTLLDGGKLAPEAEKKYRRLLHKAEVMAAFDAGL